MSNGPTLEQMEAKVREVGRLIGRECEPGSGFALFMFTMGADGHITYVSNAQKVDMISAMKEWIAHAKHDLIAPHGMPDHPRNQRRRA